MFTNMDSIKPTPTFQPHTHNELLIENLKAALALCTDDGVKNLVQSSLKMATGLEDYLENTCSPETLLQRRLYKKTLDLPWSEQFAQGETLWCYGPHMMNSRQPANFLKTIAEIGKAERILEVGMFTGYSAAAFCAVSTVKSVTSLEIDPFLVSVVKSRFHGTEEAKKFQVITGPALESLEKLKIAGETFDLVFVDADKMNYKNYYTYIMDNDLIGPGGVIVLDNTLWKGELYPEPESERGQMFVDLNDYINKDERVTQVILQISDGVSLIRRK